MNHRLLTTLAMGIVGLLAAAASANTVTLDFNTDALGGSIAAGQVLDDEFAAYGMTLSADNNRSGHPDLAIAFDSANPTGGDWDLRTPGGGLNNSTPLGNLIIIAEDAVDLDKDGLVDDPDDEARGGTIYFGFNTAITASGSVVLVDIEEHGGTIQLVNAGGVVDTVAIPGIGDNSVQTVAFSQRTFDELRVNLAGSGAVGALTLDPTTPIPEPASVALLLTGAAMIATRRRRAD